MTWTQPCCEDCWVKREGARRPHRVTAERFPGARCCFCGRSTHSGIYVRVDPGSVPYPDEEQRD